MTDPSLPSDSGWWSALAALGASAGAFVVALIRKPGRGDIHLLRNRTYAVEGRAAVLEAKYGDMDRRLTRIEDGQIRMEEKIDRLVERA